MNEILTAILEDNPRAVKALLKSHPALATCPFPKPFLFRSGICHWIYAKDTLLHLAAAGYRIEIVRLFLSAGADPNAAKNMRASTPLHYAADGHPCPAWDSKPQVETLRCLLQHGANIHAQDKNGATPLHRAVRTRCAAAVRFLLQSGSDPVIRNKPGSTPFHLAVQNTGRGGSGEPAAIAAQRDIIQQFLALGLSPKLKDARGKTVAASAQSQWIRELLNANASRHL